MKTPVGQQRFVPVNERTRFCGMRLLRVVFGCVVLFSGLLAGGGQTTAVGQTVPGADYQVRVSDYFGQLRQNGYTPLRITITRFGTAVNQGETLYAGVESELWDGATTETLTKVDFAAGQSSATIELLLSDFTGFGSFAVVSRDGSLERNPRRDLIAAIRLPDWFSTERWMGSSASFTANMTFAYFTSQPVVDTGVHFDSFWHENWDEPQELFTGPTFDPNAHGGIPNMRQLSGVTWNSTERMFHNSFYQWPTDELLANAIRTRFFVVGDFAAIPTTWVGLSRVDACLLSVEDLKVLADQHPDKLEVVRQWVAAGGRLFVLNCQSDFANLGSILPNLTVKSNRLASPRTQKWSMLEERKTYRLYAAFSASMERWRYEIGEQDSRPAPDGTYHENPITQWFTIQNIDDVGRDFSGTNSKIAQEATLANATLLYQDYGTGRILAIPDSGTLLEFEDWFKILLASTGHRGRGCFPGIGTRNHQFLGYKEFDYRTLGKPPWILFLVLITVFAVIVGPVAFIVLQRLGRMHLMLGVVPSIASAMTLAIVGFALFQDGLSIRTLKLGVTWLDSNNQTALTQTTHMVYAGISPGQLEFPRTTAYYDDSLRKRRRSGKRRVVTTEDRQFISGANIQARTKFQVTTFDVQDSTGQVLVSVSADGSKWELTNQLGFAVDLMVIRTESETLSAVNIEDGAVATLESGSQLEANWSRESIERGRQARAQIPSLLGSEFDIYGQADRISQAIGSFRNSSDLKVGDFMAVSKQQPLARELRKMTYQDEEAHLTFGQWRATTPLPAVSATEVPELLLPVESPIETVSEPTRRLATFPRLGDQ
jgi:hypothetical protein